MKKLALLVALGVAACVLAGCAKESAPAAEPTAMPVAGQTTLMTAQDAGTLPEGSTLDLLLGTEEGPSGTTVKYVQYPTAWPGEYVKGYLPEYLGAGWLYVNIITSPDQETPEAAEVVSVGVYGYEGAELAGYVEQLKELGYALKTPEEFSPDEQSLDDGMDEVYSLTGNNTSVLIYTGEDETGKFFNVTVAMVDRVNARAGIQ